ncbi:glycosyltransferase family 2 protein [Sunxiuqinia sp. A32]|uniref:glycosyltransferase family 2 protein n=1 Tax=Sunxiuqinia sp. A32 TaxID=3461496 RepID=UPI0040452E88
MKITLITATYNSYPNILDTLDSIQQQTYNDIEWIIIDGGSTDETQTVLKNNPLVSHSISESDEGIYDALNKGIKMSTGDVIGFVHSDDVFASPSTLEDLVKAFQKTQADGVFGDLQYVDKNDTNKVIRYWKSKLFKHQNLRYGWMPAHPTLFLKKEVYQKHGEFDLSFKIAADYDFMLRILQDTKLGFQYLPHVITKMRVGGASNKSLANIILKSKEDLRAIRNNNIGGVYTLLFKNIRKVSQFFRKE